MAKIHTIDKNIKERAELFHTHLPLHTFKNKRKRKFFVIGIATIKVDGDKPTFYYNIRAFNAVDALNIAYHRYKGQFIHDRFFDEDYFQKTLRHNYDCETAIIYESKKPFRR